MLRKEEGKEDLEKKSWGDWGKSEIAVIQEKGKDAEEGHVEGSPTLSNPSLC